MTSTKRTRLNFLDIVVLSVIFFGIATWQSLSMYFSAQESGAALSFDADTITDQMQWISIAQEIVLLGVAALYLWLRKFDFRVLNFKFTKWTLPLCLGLIIAGAGMSDIGMWATEALFPQTIVTQEEDNLADSIGTEEWTEPAETASLVEAQENSGESQVADSAAFVEEASSPLPEITFMSVLFALLNGFFEEVFFLGLVFATNRKALPWALLFSVVVRFGFHIYQGFPAAVGITLMGVLFMLARKRISSLTPFTLAHSFFDVFGVTLWFWIYMLIH